MIENFDLIRRGLQTCKLRYINTFSVYISIGYIHIKLSNTQHKFFEIRNPITIVGVKRLEDLRPSIDNTKQTLLEESIQHSVIINVSGSEESINVDNIICSAEIPSIFGKDVTDLRYYGDMLYRYIGYFKTDKNKDIQLVHIQGNVVPAPIEIIYDPLCTNVSDWISLRF